MIDIRNITWEYEADSLWLELNILSTEETNTPTEINVSLFTPTSEEPQSITLSEKLIKGENIIETMFSVDPLPWYPNGTGPTNVFEIYAETGNEEEGSEYRVFAHTANIEYNNELLVYGHNINIFGTALDIAGIPQIDRLSKAGFNTLFTNDRRKEIIDYCIIKGIVLLPYQAPNCTFDKIEDFRKNRKDIIIDYNEIDDVYKFQKVLKPVYVGECFISNNSEKYIHGTLKQGILEIEGNNLDLFNEEKISMPEFSNIDILPPPPSEEISFSCLYGGENIIDKKLYVNTENILGGNLLVSKFQLNETTWEVIFSSNEYIQGLHIETDQEISINNFDIFPGETVEVIFSFVTDQPDFKVSRL